MLFALLLLSQPSQAVGQDVEFWLDGGATNALPPANVDTAAALYGILGGRLLLSYPVGGTEATARFGQGAGGTTAAWLVGEAHTWMAHRFGRTLGRLELGGQALDFTDPFQYRVYAGSVQPALSGRLGSFGYVLQGTARLGHWQSNAPDTTGTRPGMFTSATIDGPMHILGGTAQLGRSMGPLWVRLEGTGLRAVNGALDGTYVSGTARVTTDIGPVSTIADVTLQHSPAENETGYGLTLAWSPTRSALLQLYAGQTVTDPVYGTQGNFAATLAVSWRVGHRAAAARFGVVDYGAWTDAGREVHFRIRAPHARRVALVGDFTSWESVPMQRDGDAWTATITLSPGVYHFGFQVDDRWTVPKDAPGIMKDGWGRTNASIVIEAKP
ncbi:MAG: glycogen-binding domain-containing protein [Gemmatimonadota bacterium]